MEDKLAILETKCEEQERRLAALDAAVKLSKYIPSEVLSEIVAVLAFGDEKHPGEEWRYIEKVTHRLHAREHLLLSRRYLGDALFHYDRRDKETNRLHLVHAICRLMFAAALELEAKP